MQRLRDDPVYGPREVVAITMNNQNVATSAQLLQLVAKFAQILPTDADKVEAQEAIENENDPIWVAIKNRFAKTVEKTVAVVKNVLKDMITAGHYYWVNSEITEENFPTPENLVLGEEPKLYHFDCGISSEKAMKLMDKDGFRPATIWDLLDFGAKNPEEQRKYPIVALGPRTLVRSSRRVACLGSRRFERDLGLSWFDDDWSVYCRFLAVRLPAQAGK